MNVTKTYTPKQLELSEITSCDHVINNQQVNVTKGGSPEYRTLTIFCLSSFASTRFESWTGLYLSSEERGEGGVEEGYDRGNEGGRAVFFNRNDGESIEN